MDRTGKILRRSIFAFLQNYQYFTTTAAFLALPFAVSSLLAQSLAPTSFLLSTIHTRLSSLFYAAGFPSSSEFVTILNLKLSQTISTSLFVLPFTLSSLLFAKASIIQALCSNINRAEQPAFTLCVSTYKPLLITQLCNFLVIISANATCFAILFFAFNALDGLGLWGSKSVLFLSAAGAVLYSIMLANALILCNLALVLSGAERRGGYTAVLRACVLIRGRSATAISLLLPANMALALTEALFQYRIVRAYHLQESSASSMAFEGAFIAYLYAILQVIDTIAAFFFFKSCKSTYQMMDQEETYCLEIEDSLKSIDELP